MGEMNPDKLEDMLQAMAPQEHHDFAKNLLTEAGVP